MRAFGTVHYWTGTNCCINYVNFINLAKEMHEANILAITAKP